MDILSVVGGQYARYAKYGIICEVRDIHEKAWTKIWEIESFSSFLRKVSMTITYFAMRNFFHLYVLLNRDLIDMDSYVVDKLGSSSSCAVLYLWLCGSWQ